MPVTVILQLNLKPEHVEEMLEGLKADLPDTRAFEGCLSVSVVRDQQDPAQISLVERWRERGDQEKYLGWRQETGTLEKTAGFLAAPINITYYDELPEV